MRFDSTFRPLGAIALAVSLAGLSACSASPEVREARFLKRGDAMMEKKDYARAIVEYTAANKTNPKDAEPWYRLGMAYWSSGRPMDAYQVFRKAAELNPSHAGAQTRLAEMMATSRDDKIAAEGKKLAEDAASLAPSDPEALYALALTEYRLGDLESSEDQLRRILGQFPTNLQSSVALATLHMERKDYAGAEKVLRLAVEKDPSSAEARLALGNTQELIGNKKAAETTYQDLLKTQPKNGPALLRLARLHLEAGRTDEAERSYRTLSQSDSKEFQSAYAFFLWDRGRIDEAISEFRRLADSDRTDRVARSRLVTAYLAQNNLAEAQKIVDGALHSNPKDGSALFQRSEIDIRQRQYDAAQDHLSALLNLNPNSGEAHYLLSEVHRARGATLLQRQELAEALRLKSDLAPARVALAYSWIAAKDPKSALAALDAAPSRVKSNPQWITARNWTLLAMKNPAEARKGIDAALSQSKNSGVLLQDALLKLQQNDHPGARAALESVLRAEPSNTEALRLLANSYAERKQTADAIRIVQGYAKAQPGSFAMQVFAGNWFYQHGDLPDAAAAATAAKSADPRSPVPDLLLAQVEWGQGNNDGARARLGAVLSAAPANAPAHLLLGMLDENSGNHSAAIDHYRKVLESDPRNAVAVNALAYQLGNHTRELDEAYRLAQEAKQLDPRNPAVDDTLGWILLRKGDYRAASRYLQSAASASTDPVIKYHLAINLLKLGDLQQGRRVLTAAMQANAKLPEADLAREALAEAVTKVR